MNNLRIAFNMGKKGQGKEACLGKGYGKDFHRTLTPNPHWLLNLYPCQITFSYIRENQHKETSYQTQETSKKKQELTNWM